MSERNHTAVTPSENAARGAERVLPLPGMRVRKRDSSVLTSDRAGTTLPRPAHPSNRLVAQVNGHWRVIDEPLQCILQRKKGNPRKKNPGWTGRSFCRTREALLRCVREHCGEVDPPALEKLNALPEWHLDWDCTNLDVHGTDQGQPDGQSELLLTNALEGSDADR